MKTKGSRPLHIIKEESSIVVLILLPGGGPDQGQGEPQDGLDGDLEGHQGHLRQPGDMATMNKDRTCNML